MATKRQGSGRTPVATASLDAAAAKLIDTLPRYFQTSPEAAAAAKRAADLLSAPHVQPWLAMVEVLEATARHPGVQQSPEHVELLNFLVPFFNDWLSPGGAARALDELHAVLSIRLGAGRPTNDDIYRRWQDQVEDLRRTRPTLTTRERYEEVAEGWSRMHAPVKWTAVRNGISKLKKREPGPGVSKKKKGKRGAEKNGVSMTRTS
jgi:hypothetical protein